MKTFLTFFCVFVILSVAVASRDYCNLSCDRYQHIGCGHDYSFDKHNCPKDAKMVKITESVKQLIVNLHNEKRNLIAGGGDSNHDPACNMPSMEWDNELAELAALNVKQCRMNHDRCHNTELFKLSGQNLASGYKTPIGDFTAEQIFEKSIQSWFNEVHNSYQGFIDSYPENYSGPAIGHFTVMMSDKNTHVGCAASTYSKYYRSYYLIACNYAYTNVIGRPIYTACASPAASCPQGKHPFYQNLCA